MTDTELPRFYRQRDEGGGWKVINRATQSPIGFQFADMTNVAKAVELANQVYEIGASLANEQKCGVSVRSSCVGWCRGGRADGDETVYEPVITSHPRSPNPECIDQNQRRTEADEPLNRCTFLSSR